MHNIFSFLGYSMLLQELGRSIRRARSQRRLTQASVAVAGGVSRNTLNRLENGVFPDIGIKKAQAILEGLGMELVVQPIKPKAEQLDFASMASASASVSFKKELAPDELVYALLSGKATPGKEAHYIVLLEEAPKPLLKGLVDQVGALVKAGKVEKNLAKIATQLGLADASWQNKIA
jgi:transcriptional regulator with XRE-family HTH domain